MSNSKSIAVNYLRGWFIVDLLAALPFDHLYASNIYSGEVRHLELKFFKVTILIVSRFNINSRNLTYI